MTITIHAPTPEALKDLSSRLCAEDVAELQAAGWESPLAALEASLRDSRESYVACWDGRVQAAFGVADYMHDDMFGVPWMLSTGPRGAVRREFLKTSAEFIAAWRPMYRGMFNFVDARHVRAQRWLLYLGFQPFKVHSINDHPFIEFGVITDV